MQIEQRGFPFLILSPLGNGILQELMELLLRSNSIVWKSERCSQIGHQFRWDGPGRTFPGVIQISLFNFLVNSHFDPTPKLESYILAEIQPLQGVSRPMNTQNLTPPPTCPRLNEFCQCARHSLKHFSLAFLRTNTQDRHVNLSQFTDVENEGKWLVRSRSKRTLEPTVTLRQ